mmetsp:Transcript_28152/g.51274  ORF Transcript_28152/g.51274 Transcript_28152/m.51274 type:complete len:393 (-) Transcript_28152:1702-2880(-)
MKRNGTRTWWMLAAIWFLLERVQVASSLSSSRKNGNNNVRVQVEQSLGAHISPGEAKEAWMAYQWKRGGGLPVWISLPEEHRRRIMPIGMEETLILQRSENPNKDNNNELHYKVTGMGLLASELEQDSHSAQVRFDDDGTHNGTNMSWNVEFNATHRADLWKAITEANIRTASANLASFVKEPRVYRRTTRLTSPTAMPENLSKQWVNFVWKQGGGLPIPPPLQLNDEKRVIIPPFLVERIERATEKEILYTVVNPGVSTYPVHTHLGRVTFRHLAKEDEVEMVWEVEIRPLRGFALVVELFTSVIVSTLARNFKTHLAEPGAIVVLKKPRGGSDSSFGNIPKDTWLGGVLAAHLTDKRSTTEQTIALFQPWTWGRSTDDIGEGEEWTNGHI